MGCNMAASTGCMLATAAAVQESAVQESKVLDHHTCDYLKRTYTTYPV